MKFIQKNRHFLPMAAGCIAMLVALFAFTTMTSGDSRGVYLLLLLCPAMHFLMHRGVHVSRNRHEIPHAQLPTPKKEVSIREQRK